jgi:Txe/YoeB family toxin of toxin-antitoxin system
VVTWEIVLSSEAAKDAKKLSAAGLRPKAERLLSRLQQDPFATPPRFEKLVGNLAGFYSRRINIQYRLVYRVDEERGIVHVLRMWTHYE